MSGPPGGAPQRTTTVFPHAGTWHASGAPRTTAALARPGGAVRRMAGADEGTGGRGWARGCWGRNRETSSHLRTTEGGGDAWAGSPAPLALAWDAAHCTWRCRGPCASAPRCRWLVVCGGTALHLNHRTFRRRRPYPLPGFAPTVLLWQPCCWPSSPWRPPAWARWRARPRHRRRRCRRRPARQRTGCRRRPSGAA